MITIRIRTTLDVIINSVILAKNSRHAREFLMSGNGALTTTYAKVYYRGGGWYAISGYAHDGSDVHKVIDHIKDLKSVRGAVLKEGGYYFNKEGNIVGVYEERLDISKWVAINKAIQRSPLTGGKRIKVNIEQREYHSPI